jgi:5-methylcytosine-specific restriction endonuclease McrA
MDNNKVLVLNGDYYPMSTCSTKRAVTLMLMNRVEVVKVRNEWWSSAEAHYQLPSAIKLKKYIHKPWTQINLTKRNIHIRDNFTCQYCGKHHEKLTVDHVVPSSRGGAFSWENLVTCCYKCNNQKDDHTLEQCGLSLIRHPKKPSFIEIFRILWGHNPEWDEFLPGA